MALMRLCPRCSKIIDYSDKYCNDCNVIIEKQCKERYKNYSKRRTDKKEQLFYHSREWQEKRLYILLQYNYIDVYSYYKQGIIIPATLVHHIIPIKNMWDKRLDDFNMFVCDEVSHNEIHRRIETEGLEVVAKELLEFNERFKKEFNIKVNC